MIPEGRSVLVYCSFFFLQRVSFNLTISRKSFIFASFDMGYIANNCKEPHSSPDVSAAGSAMLDGYRVRDPQLHAHGV